MEKCSEKIENDKLKTVDISEITFLETKRFAGSYGHVSQAKYGDQFVALKTPIEKDVRSMKNFEQEIQIHRFKYKINYLIVQKTVV